MITDGQAGQVQKCCWNVGLDCADRVWKITDQNSAQQIQKHRCWGQENHYPGHFLSFWFPCASDIANTMKCGFLCMLNNPVFNIGCSVWIKHFVFSIDRMLTGVDHSKVHSCMKVCSLGQSIYCLGSKRCPIL